MNNSLAENVSSTNIQSSTKKHSNLFIVQDPEKDIIMKKARMMIKDPKYNLFLRTPEQEERVLSYFNEVLDDPCAKYVTGRLNRPRLETTLLHSIDVSLLAISYAVAKGQDDKECISYGLGGIVHDNGKADDKFADILASDKKLTDAQFETIKMHGVEGYVDLILQDFSGIHVLCTLEHHPDYPAAHNRDVTKLSKVIAGADQLGALTENRKYRRRLGVDQALEIMRENVNHGKLNDWILTEFYRMKMKSASVN